jgi:DNA mismatch repair protein MutS2
MIKFQEAIQSQSGLRHIYDRLDIRSSNGRQKLLKQNFIIEEKELSKEIIILAEIVEIIECSNNNKTVSKLQNSIGNLRNISQTIESLSAQQIADDIQLFEIKHFAILSQSIAEILNLFDIKFLKLHNLEKAISILDPDNQGIPHFYIYSSYNSNLAKLRKELNQYLDDENIDKAEEIRLKCSNLEDKIRAELSLKLIPFCKNLSENLEIIAYLDILVAKAKIAVEQTFCKPQISKKNTVFTGIFNPQIKEKLQHEGKEFQAIDIKLDKEPILITGANMTGKTVLLKTIALAQYMFQFGFFIPASKAIIAPVEKVMQNISENQSELSGLSSFATEILNINKIILAASRGEKLLILIDELARTTNPEEGKAIVSACIQMLKNKNTFSLITTHYSGLNANCRKLRVKGLTEYNPKTKININNINDFVDYSLTEVKNEEVPAEAIRIAEILGVDAELIKLSKTFFKKKQ